MKRFLIHIAMASGVLGAWGMSPEQHEPGEELTVTPGESPAAEEADDVVLIKDDMLPEGGSMTTYLSDMIVANISSYGVTWYEDSGLAMFVYRTDSGDVYVKNLSTYSDTWVKGYAEDGSIWIPTGQPIMVTNKGSVYRLVTAVVDMSTNRMETRAGIRFYVSDDGKELRMEQSPDENHVLGFYTMVVEKGSISQAFSRIHLTELDAEPVTPPQDADFHRYDYSAMLGGYQPWENRSWIAFDGSDVYVQGLEWIYPGGWVKGTLMSDGSIRIPSGQFLGLNGNYAHYYLAAQYDGEITDGDNIRPRNAFFLNYDAATGGYTLQEGECFFAGQDMSYGFPVVGSRFTPFPITPGTPLAADNLQWDETERILRFHIPMTDTGGAPLDRYLLTYKLYINGEQYTFPPLGLTGFEEKTTLSANASFPRDEESYWGRNPGDEYILSVDGDCAVTSLGITLIYDVLGEIHESSEAHLTVTGLTGITADGKHPVGYYSVDGRRLARPEGFCIVRYSDGTSSKVLTRTR